MKRARQVDSLRSLDLRSHCDSESAFPAPPAAERRLGGSPKGLAPRGRDAGSDPCRDGMESAPWKLHCGNHLLRRKRRPDRNHVRIVDCPRGRTGRMSSGHWKTCSGSTLKQCPALSWRLRVAFRSCLRLAATTCANSPIGMPAGRPYGTATVGNSGLSLVSRL